MYFCRYACTTGHGALVLVREVAFLEDAALDVGVMQPAAGRGAVDRQANLEFVQRSLRQLSEQRVVQVVERLFNAHLVLLGLREAEAAELEEQVLLHDQDVARIRAAACGSQG